MVCFVLVSVICFLFVVSYDLLVGRFACWFLGVFLVVIFGCR